MRGNIIDPIPYINQIREACIKANPEIMELKFGCLVQYEGYSRPFIFLRPTRGAKHAILTLDYSELKIGHEKGYEILGRPIRLADVLLAIRLTRYEVSFDFQIEPQNFAICCDALEEDRRVAFWNLKDDNLEHQSPETLELIASLL